jgi:hypothetical protein
MGFPLYLPDRTLSFVRWARAARESHLAAGSLALPERIVAVAGELGLWLEDLVHEGLATALAAPASGAWEPAIPSWWHKAPRPAQLRRRGRNSLPGEPRSSPLGQSLTIMRIICKWSRPQLAAAVGTPERTSRIGSAATRGHAWR